ncbi:MAG: hypothetical protein PVF55_01960 [Desulfobacterales bacterium]
MISTQERGAGALRACPEEGGEAPTVFKIDAESSNAGNATIGR